MGYDIFGGVQFPNGHLSNPTAIDLDAWFASNALTGEYGNLPYYPYPSPKIMQNNIFK